MRKVKSNLIIAMIMIAYSLSIAGCNGGTLNLYVSDQPLNVDAEPISVKKTE